jgi:hypothetical protein
LQFAGSDESEVLQKALDNIDKDIEQLAYKEVFGVDQTKKAEGKAQLPMMKKGF